MIKDGDDPEVQRLNSNQQVSYQPHYECCCSPWCAAGAWKEAWRRGNTASANSAPMQTQPTPAQVETLSLHMALTRLCYSFPHFPDSAMATVCLILEKPELESCPNCRTGWLSLFLLSLSSFFVCCPSCRRISRARVRCAARPRRHRRLLLSHTVDRHNSSDLVASVASLVQAAPSPGRPSKEKHRAVRGSEDPRISHPGRPPHIAPPPLSGSRCGKCPQHTHATSGLEEERRTVPSPGGHSLMKKTRPNNV